MTKKITLINIISSILLQFLTIVSYFIIPKIILNYFGSETNGLVSSINQFLNYITLIEGGITGVITANLYKPLSQKKYNQVSSILKTADIFYKKIGFIYIIYALCLAIFYPIIFRTKFSWTFVFLLTIILSINLLVQYMFSLTYKTLLSADKKVYIVSLTQSFITALSIILAYLSVKIFPSIHILKFATGILYFLQPIIYKRYINKNYTIDMNVKEDNNIIKQRWNGVAINIAAFVHLSTDISLLTIFTNLSTVSIYTVYTLVTNGLRQIINSISNAIVPTLGQTYVNGDSKEINEKMDLFEYIIFMFVFFSFSIAYLLITPFVMIYTKGLYDANYYQPIFGIIILISEALYLLKLPHVNLAYSANKFKELTKPSFYEVIINIIISIVLIKKHGLIGVAIGTLIAMLYRLIFQVYYTTKIINNRNQIRFYTKFIKFLLGAIIGIFICYKIPFKIYYTVESWLLHAIIYFVVFGIIYMLLSLMFFKKELKYINKYLKLGSDKNA